MLISLLIAFVIHDYLFNLEILNCLKEGPECAVHIEKVVALLVGRHFMAQITCYCNNLVTCMDTVEVKYISL